MPEYAFGRRRSANIAHTDEEHACFLVIFNHSRLFPSVVIGNFPATRVSDLPGVPAGHTLAAMPVRNDQLQRRRLSIVAQITY
ncbi:MAG: hypothetical protein P8Y01_08560 [Woeseiaceae bacterium]